MVAFLLKIFNNSFDQFWVETRHLKKCLHVDPQMYKIVNPRSSFVFFFKVLNLFLIALLKCPFFKIGKLFVTWFVVHLVWLIRGQ